MTYRSHETYNTLSMGKIIQPHGNYRELLSYQKAEIVYDITYRFCKRFLTRRDRTIDQMVQAARSGKQKGTSIYLFHDSIASLSGARNPHVLCVHSGFCAPFALHLNRS